MKYLNLVESIKNKKSLGVIPVIAEIKRLTPKLEKEKGIKKDMRDAGLLAKLFQKAGAAGISLVTEKKYFGGQPEIDIPRILTNVKLPLLIKDFITDVSKIDYYTSLVTDVGKEMPNRVTLLLISHKVVDKLQPLIDYIHQKGMLAQVEIRGMKDLHFLSGLRTIPRLIGFNNKKIDELERGRNEIILNEYLIRACREIVGDSFIISSSAHQSVEDVRRSIQSGADAVLAGSVFMQAKNPVKTIRNFVNAL